MLGFNAFKGINRGVMDGLEGSGQKISLGIHNSLLQLGNVSGFSNPAMVGAGAGAAYGALNGAFGYDGSVLGGAFHGAVLGGVGGAGLKFAADTYAKGAVKSNFAKETNGVFTNAWEVGNSAFKSTEGKQMGAFQTSAFKNGW